MQFQSKPQWCFPMEFNLTKINTEGQVQEEPREF